jgi:hypothetical protein
MRALALVILCGGALSLAACGGGADVHNADAGPLPDAQDVSPDAGDCPAPACDFFTQDGCDSTIDKCTIVDDAPGCGPAGDSPADTDCSLDSQCEANTICASYADAQRCMAFCDNTHPCGADSACFVRVTTDGCDVARVCGQTCTLLFQNCDGAAQGCYPSPSILPVMEKGICVDAGDGAHGSACTAANDCVEGATCTDDGFCHQLCPRAAGLPVCPEGTTCQELAGHTTTGVCR